MSSKREPVSVDRAVDMLDVRGEERRVVHTFVQPAGGVLVGADWDLDDVIALIKLDGAELAGVTATRMGHGLVVTQQRGDGLFRHVFIATTPTQDPDQ